MATTARDFYPSTTEQDFTAGGELDIRKLVEAAEANDNSTNASFGTAAAEIILDPYTGRSTTGTADAANFGWAVNRLGSDGMDSTSSAKRIIPSGTWSFQGRLATLAAVSAYRIRWRIYRVSSTGARSLLFGPIDSQQEVPVSTGTVYTATSSQSQITLEANETLLVSWGVEKMSGTVLAEGVNLDTNGSAGSVCKITVPTPGVRTLYPKTHSAIVNALASVLRKARLSRSRTVNAAPTMARNLTLFRSATDTAGVTPTMSRRLTIRRAAANVVTATASLAKRVRLPRAAIAQGTPARATLKVKLPRSRTVNVTPIVAKKLSRTVSRTVNVLATGARALTVRRTFVATVSVVRKAYANMETRLIPTGGGGGETVVIHDASSTGGSPIGLQFIKPAGDEDRKRVPDETLAAIIASLLTFKKPRNH